MSLAASDNKFNERTNVQRNRMLLISIKARLRHLLSLWNHKISDHLPSGSYRIRRGRGWSALLATWSPLEDNRADCLGEQRWKRGDSLNDDPPSGLSGTVSDRRETSSRWISVVSSNSPLMWSHPRRSTFPHWTTTISLQLKDNYFCHFCFDATLNVIVSISSLTYPSNPW